EPGKKLIPTPTYGAGIDIKIQCGNEPARESEPPSSSDIACKPLREQARVSSDPRLTPGKRMARVVVTRRRRVTGDHQVVDKGFIFGGKGVVQCRHIII